MDLIRDTQNKCAKEKLQRVRDGGRVKGIVREQLRKVGLQIRRLPSGPPNPICLWEEDREFNGIIAEVVDYTLVDKIRSFMIYQCARQVGDLPGQVAEVGEYKGGTGRLLARTFGPSGKSVHLFDTFTGMPATDGNRDLHEENDFRDASLESVMAYLGDCSNVHIHPGLFPDTATSVENATFSPVHIDADIYKSVMSSCRFFYPRLEAGGIMIFDDYGFLSCPGARSAVDEFMSNKPEHACYLPTGQCLVLRR